jgi:hypothetical protein
VDLAFIGAYFKWSNKREGYGFVARNWTEYWVIWLDCQNLIRPLEFMAHRILYHSPALVSIGPELWAKTFQNFQLLG